MATETRNRLDKNGKSSSSDAGIAQRYPRNRTELATADREQYPTGPFGLLRHMQDEMDRWFGRLGLGSVPSPSSLVSRAGEAIGDWSPAIDAFQRGNDFVVRADVPGMKRPDLTVEVGDDTLTIRGDRKHEHHEEGEGVFWSERSYGSFCRVVPLPPGAISDSAKATFNNGVLEVVIQAPSQEARRGRRVDISGHDDASKK